MRFFIFLMITTILISAETKSIFKENYNWKLYAIKKPIYMLFLQYTTKELNVTIPIRSIDKIDSRKIINATFKGNLGLEEKNHLKKDLNISKIKTYKRGKAYFTNFIEGNNTIFYSLCFNQKECTPNYYQYKEKKFTEAPKPKIIPLIDPLGYKEFRFEDSKGNGVHFSKDNGDFFTDILGLAYPPNASWSKEIKTPITSERDFSEHKDASWSKEIKTLFNTFKIRKLLKNNKKESKKECIVTLNRRKNSTEALKESIEIQKTNKTHCPKDFSRLVIDVNESVTFNQTFKISELLDLPTSTYPIIFKGNEKTLTFHSKKRAIVINKGTEVTLKNLTIEMNKSSSTKYYHPNPTEAIVVQNENTILRMKNVTIKTPDIAVVVENHSKLFSYRNNIKANKVGIELWQGKVSSLEDTITSTHPLGIGIRSRYCSTKGEKNKISAFLYKTEIKAVTPLYMKDSLIYLDNSHLEQAKLKLIDTSKNEIIFLENTLSNE